MYHLHIHRLSQGQKSGAMKVFDYICRTGKFDRRGDRVRLVRGVHLPKWTGNVIGTYWLALDSFHKRANARLLYTIVVAIPRALTVQQQDELVHKLALFVARTSSGIGRRVGVPVAYAIHDGIRSDDATTGRLSNPHVHLMVSTSIDDGVHREPLNWFIRSNSAKPEEGGAPRSKVIGGRRWLIRVRRGWARLANAALKMAGLSDRIDHRSHRARGLEQLPTRHLGPHAAAAVRAGKPSPVASFNASVESFNFTLEAWYLRRRKLEETERRLDEQESVFVLEAADTGAPGLHAFLRQHPFSGHPEGLQAAASILVLRAPGDQPSRQHSGRLSDLIKRLRQGLGRGCSLVADHDRVWILREGGDCIAVAGADFVACDSAGPGIGAWIGRIACTMGITSVVARSLPGNDTVQGELSEWMSANGGQCRWTDTAAASVPKRSHRSGP